MKHRLQLGAYERIFALDYEKVHEKYKLVENPNAPIILYRGDIVGLESGIPSNAYLTGDIETILKAKSVIESGKEKEIHELIDMHTDRSRNSPLVSTTFNPEQAQVYARKEGTTIYKIKLQAERCIIDPDNIGGTGDAGEIFVLGGIIPGDITAVKINNDLFSSELYKEGRYKTYQPRDPKNREIKDPNNWRILR